MPKSIRKSKEYIKHLTSAIFIPERANGDLLVTKHVAINSSSTFSLLFSLANTDC